MRETSVLAMELKCAMRQQQRIRCFLSIQRIQQRLRVGEPQARELVRYLASQDLGKRRNRSSKGEAGINWDLASLKTWLDQP